MSMLEVFEEAGQAAGEISFSHPAKSDATIVVEKGDPADFATQADLDAGSAIEKVLQAKLPLMPIVSEENTTGQSDKEFIRQRQNILNNGTFVVVDDLDATLRYKTGSDDFGHIIGAVQNGILTHSMMYMPARHIMVTAQWEHGCTLNETRCVLDQSAKLDDNVIYLVKHKDIDRGFDTMTSDIIYELKPGGYVCFNSNIAAFCSLLKGEIVAILIAGKLWDAAGAIAVTEAGGFVASADGQPLNWQRIPQVIVAAANEKIGKSILEYTSRYPHYERDFYNNPKFQS